MEVVHGAPAVAVAAVAGGGVGVATEAIGAVAGVAVLEAAILAARAATLAGWLAVMVVMAVAEAVAQLAAEAALLVAAVVMAVAADLGLVGPGVAGSGASARVGEVEETSLAMGAVGWVAAVAVAARWPPAEERAYLCLE